MNPSDRRRAWQWALLAFGFVAGVWAVLLLVGLGTDVSLFGWRISTHNPRRPLIAAALALGVFVVTGGLAALPAMVRALRAGVTASRAAVGLAVLTGVIAYAWGTRSVGGADSYGYLSQADLWASGQVVQSQPWAGKAPWPNAGATFAPLGYRAGADPATITPVYSPGFPIALAIAKVIGGHCAAFAVVPISGGVLVLATFGLGRRFSGAGAGLVAAWLVATSPVFLFMVMTTMADVPGAAAWTVAFYLICGTSTRSALAAGLATSAAMLIRSNLAPMAIVPAAWLAIGAWRTRRESGGVAPGRAIAFAVGLLPGSVALAVVNGHLYGSPFRFGYGDTTGFFAAAHVVPNITHFVAWLVDTETPLALVGLAALCVPVARVWPRAPRVSPVLMLACFVASVWIEYGLYLVFDDWWYLRFLLPSWPLMMIGLAQAGAWALRSRLAVVRVATVAVVVWLGVRGVLLADSRRVFDTRLDESSYPAVGQLVRRETLPNSVVFSVQHSGTVRYYGGRMTIRFDALDPAWLDRAVAWLTARGVHCYAVLDEAEVVAFRQRFGADGAIGRLESAPIAEYTGVGHTVVYDLAPDPRAPVSVPHIDTSVDTRCVPPAGRPALRLPQ